MNRRNVPRLFDNTDSMPRHSDALKEGQVYISAVLDIILRYKQGRQVDLDLTDMHIELTRTLRL